MTYLIFNSPEEATGRSDQAGKAANLPYHRGDNDPTRYVWMRTFEHGAEPRGALMIDERPELLTTVETAELVNELPADWVYMPNPFV